jgi:hypothetical protein
MEFSDGWLINIENKIEYEYLDKLEYFLRKLRDQLRQQVHNTTQGFIYTYRLKNIYN